MLNNKILKMKKIFLFFILIGLGFSIKAQVPQITGFWQCNSGNIFQIEGYNLGFRYRVSTNNTVYQATFLANNYGIATFRSDFNDGSFSLFMIKSLNEICTSNSNNPNVLYTWTRINGFASPNQNTYNGYGGQYIQNEPKKCGVCNGTGNSNSVVYPPNYGTPSADEWCNICKSWRKPHTHKPCYSCGGLGEK
jgi:hypothetical protein